MSRDLRTFRNWWIAPIQNTDLKAGANTITITAQSPDEHATIYGDYRRNTEFIPSLRSFSYTKGFTTFDHRDPRVFEKQDLNAISTESRLLQGAPEGDLSSAFGKQFGQYRIHLLNCSGPTPANSPDAAPQTSSSIGGLMGLAYNSTTKQTTPVRMSEAIHILGGKDKQEVVAQNPNTFAPELSSIELKNGLPNGLRFFFTSKLTSHSNPHPCFINLSFEGTDSDGKARAWNSQWQPIGINVVKNAAVESSFGDIIPSEVLAWKNLHCKILFSPFQPDLLFLKKKEALKASIEIADAQLTFLPPLSIPSDAEARQWTLF